VAQFLLIRHGDNNTLGKKLAGRLPDVHLNPNGKAQAEHLAKELSHLPIKAVYSSPLERAQETAQPIAQAHHLNVELLPSLVEVDFGDWQGKSLKVLKHLGAWKMVQEQPASFCFPNGESLAAAQTRAVESLIGLTQQYSETDVLVCVSHSDIIRLAVAYFLGMPLDHFQRIRIAPASITLLSLSAGKAAFGAINQTFNAVQLHEK
jgi:probable phosphoglycerate mutase